MMLLKIIMREELMVHDALVMFQSIFYASIIELIMPSLKGIKEKRLLGDDQHLPLLFLCVHMIRLL